MRYHRIPGTAFPSETEKDISFTPEEEALADREEAEWLAKAPERKNVEIGAQLTALDLKRIRPLAEGDTVYLAKLNAEAVSLRAKLK